MIRFPLAPLACLLVVAGGCGGDAPDGGQDTVIPASHDAAATSASTIHACFSETGFCITGSIHAYWQANGGLAAFGYPISPRRIETVEGRALPVQWFERGRLEIHGPTTVAEGRVGARALEREGTPWTTLPKVTSAPAGCRFFAETGHSLCAPFLRHWEERGGLRRFGFPLSEPATRDGRLSQAFERARLEHHREHAGTAWEVQGAHLGRWLLARDSDFTQRPARPFANKVGWAYHVRPTTSRAQMFADMQRMKAAGTNVVYVSHANPGEVTSPSEPGLTFATYWALANGTTSKTDAERQLRATLDALDASAAAGLEVVLAIGYQIQLGTEWNAAKATHLRRTADGKELRHWGSLPTASPYSPEYQRDIAAYYAWVQRTVLAKYPNVLALNLGDEPMGADFSVHAKRAFRDAYGVDFDRAPEAARGDFIAGQLADFAAQNASMWQRENPNVWVLMTWHVQRDVPWFPSFERIFADTPGNFVFSSDTHYHDAPPEIPIMDLSLLANQIRTDAWLSRVYDKPLMLWTSANRWGLPKVNAPGTSRVVGVEEAKLNARMVIEETKKVGGHLGMVMAFSYNCGHDLGLYDSDRGGVALGFSQAEADAIFGEVSATMATARPSLHVASEGVPSDVLVLDRAKLDVHVARERVDHITGPLVDLRRERDVLARGGVVLVDGRAAREATQRGARARIVR